MTSPLNFFLAIAALASSLLGVQSEWTATDSLRQYMRQAPGAVHGDVQHLRGTVDLNRLMDEALLSARLSKVQSAMEAALRAQEAMDFIDEDKFRQVQAWYTELDRRMGLIEHCKRIKGQGWDGECLLIDNWWKSVRYHGTLDHPWQSH